MPEPSFDQWDFEIQLPRPSDNFLRDYLLPRNAYHKADSKVSQHVYQPGECLPADANIWVSRPRGRRQVTESEWILLKGYDSSQIIEDLDAFLHLPSVHLWNLLGAQASSLLQESVNAVTMLTTPPAINRGFSTVPQLLNSEWSWQPPSFRKRGPWYRARISNLRAACRTMLDEQVAFQEGLQILNLHSQNYGDDGPKHLILLWWEWPNDKWIELRNGLSMIFLATPLPGLVSNAPMNDEELATAITFVDELISLGVLEEEPSPENVVNNCSLFLVPKPGQPGQYRCIADMKKGGQNKVVGPDPVQMTSPGDILPRLYPGGYSATLDIANFFHMFPTIETERIFMGCIHPGNGKMYRYKTLPMGSGNSPGSSGRFGATFRRLVEETLPAFQGIPHQNDFATALSGRGFDPDLGRGRVLMGPDGLPSCLLWLHVDDCLLHGPTKSKCMEGLRQLLDLSVTLGFICQRAKTVPPCQCVKFCGFEYDTVGIPTLRVLTEKRHRAFAQLQYILRPNVKLSRFGLAICIGNLQSLVPATPSNIEASFLRHAYSCLHYTDQDHHTCSLAFYAEEISLSPLGRLDLLWWVQCLRHGLESTVQVQHSTHFGVRWGDGSGTGTGGTFEWVAANSGPLPTF